jgi:precorrin-3B C17-methyltransferase
MDCAFRMGVPVALYNPKSRGRPDNLAQALTAALQYRDSDTPVAVVKNAFRDSQEVRFFTLRSLVADDTHVDMRSIVIIGGEGSRIGTVGDKEMMITPRGYDRKYVY